MKRVIELSADRIIDAKSNFVLSVSEDTAITVKEEKTVEKFDVDEAFCNISEKYSDMILRLCLVTLKCRFDADDALQEVMLRLYMKLKKTPSSEAFESEEHTKAWLIRVAINRCKTMQEEKRRQKKVLFDEKFIGSSEKTSNEDTVWLNEYLFELPEKQRKLLYLFYYEGYSTEKIAKLLDISSGSVRTSMSRARAKLKSMIQKKQKKERESKD